MFNDITAWESEKLQDKCLGQAKDVATHVEKFRPGYWCLQSVNGDKLALSMISELVISTHPVFK